MWANNTIFRQLGGLRSKSDFDFFISLVESFVAWEDLGEEDYCVKLSNNHTNTRLRANLLALIIKQHKRSIIFIKCVWCYHNIDILQSISMYLQHDPKESPATIFQE